MKIMYIGDVMAEPGLKVVEKLLPGLRREYDLDLVIAQAENVSDGRGVRRADFERLLAAGVDFCSGGNWTLHDPQINDYLSDPQQPILRPANYPAGTAGRQYKYAHTNKGEVLVVSLLGSIVGKDADKPLDNPLRAIDRIFQETHGDGRVATVINLHGDYSSEKVIIGHYLDGQASLVVGDHWHVPTNDARVLPGGTAHQTDVGMCGTLNDSLGVKLESVVPRWRDGSKTHNMLSIDGPYQFNALLVETDRNGLAKSAQAIRQIIN